MVTLASIVFSSYGDNEILCIRCLQIHLAPLPSTTTPIEEQLLSRGLADGISQRMLTTTLHNLERDGFLSREVFPEVPPRVEYELTGLVLSLLEPMQQLVQRIGGNWSSIKEARESFDRRAR
jgi:DNA-binding HxlR family transcriptional regulator